MKDFKFKVGDKVSLKIEKEDEKQIREVMDIRYTVSEGVVYVVSAKHLDLKKAEITPAVLFAKEDELQLIKDN
jgi:hypothetical protein